MKEVVCDNLNTRISEGATRLVAVTAGTNWSSGTHKGTKPERPRAPPAEIRQIRVPAIDRRLDGDNGNQMISVRPAAPAKTVCFRPKEYTTKGVGMRHCTETRWMRFSAHADRLHARLHQR
jgi:hypothetical protein